MAMFNHISFFTIIATSIVAAVVATDTTTTPDPVSTSSISPVYRKENTAPIPYLANAGLYPYGEMYPMAYSGSYLSYPPKQAVMAPVTDTGYMSTLIPAAQAALQVAIRLFAKVGLFLMGGAALLVVGGIFVTAVCSITPICTVTFHGLGIQGIDRESMRAMVSPDKISAAAALVQDAIGKYQRLQRAVSK